MEVPSSTLQRDADGTRTFNVDLFDALMANLGHTTHQAKAAAIGIDRRTLYRWRNRKISAPDLARTTQIAAALGVSVDVLFPPAARATTIPAQRGTR